MNPLGKYCIGAIALLLVGFLCWYFSSIIAYILVAVVISFFGHPIINLLGKIEIRGKRIPNAPRAAIALACIWTIFVLFFYTVIPLVSSELNDLGDISISGIASKLDAPLSDLEETLKRVGIIEPNRNAREDIVQNLKTVFDVTRLNNLFGSIAGTIGGVFIALFSVTFMAFFFLKDSNLFYKMLLTIVPTRFGDGVGKALSSIQKLLVRYFIGITLEVLIVMGLNIAGLTLVGIPFNNAVLIGLITGITNLIPYIGPLIGAAFGLSVGLAANVDLDFYTLVLPLLLYMSIVFLVTQLIDNLLLQPLIYGNSVHAHPMEIFLVILIAGNLAGIPGMILAIPGYTVLRVILREFFNKYKLVKSITKSLEVSDEKPLS